MTRADAGHFAADFKRWARKIMIAEAIITVKRFATPIKCLGLVFLIFHCATTDIRFNPLWVLVYIGITVTVANVGVGCGFLLRKLRPSTPADASAQFTTEERRCVTQMDAQGRTLRRNPWRVLLIPGEDGLFFLPLLYVGVSFATAAIAAAIFTMMHYKDKTTSALIGTFLFSTANAVIVLPHGILAMVVGHLILDAAVFGLAPTLKCWVESDQSDEQKAQPPPAPYREPAARLPER